MKKSVLHASVSNKPSGAAQLHCRQCHSLQYCLDAWLDRTLIRYIYPILVFRGPFEKNDVIYRKGDAAKSIFVVRSGAVKVIKPLGSEVYDVDGFYFGGDLFGFESLDDRIQAYEAVALTEANICEIPLKKFEELSMSVRKIQQMFIAELANQIRRKTDRLYFERHLSAVERLQLFLKDVFERNQEQMSSDNRKLPLPMSKVDMALYLGMSPESLSRGLAKLQSQGLIRNHLRYIEIRNVRKLLLPIATP